MMSSPHEQFLDLGVSPEQAQRALRLLAADGCGEEALALRVTQLAALARACGNLQNAKLAYSLITRNEESLKAGDTELLASALRHCECVPAAVKLWKAARQVGAVDETLLITAARLGADGAEQLRILEILRRHPEWGTTVAELARRLVFPGWSADGSWGAVPDPEHGLIWWDFAAPHERQAFGMSLTSNEIDLRHRVGTQLRFECRLDITGVTDRCHLEITTDGKKWTKLARYQGQQDWHTEEVDLQAYGGEVVRLRFQVLSGGQREGRGFEMSQPRLRALPVVRRVPLKFSELSEGWRERPDGQRNLSLSGHQSEEPLLSDLAQLQDMESPTLTFQARLMASSVYAKSSVQALGPEDEVLGELEVPPGSEWANYRFTLKPEASARVRLWSRFNSRREDDGLWVRGLRIQGGQPDGWEIVPLDGGGEDGSRERRGLLDLLRTEDMPRLETLARLRQGLPSLASALALLPLVEKAEHVPVLLHLFSVLKDEAVPSFALLQDLAVGQDLELQCKVLLTSGAENYASTRDYLGEGLLSEGEFEQNCRLYLSLRESWNEESARAGLAALLTPVAEESLEERLAVFDRLRQEHPEPNDFFAAWEESWY